MISYFWFFFFFFLSNQTEVRQNEQAEYHPKSKNNKKFPFFSANKQNLANIFYIYEYPFEGIGAVSDSNAEAEEVRIVAEEGAELSEWASELRVRHVVISVS